MKCCVENCTSYSDRSSKSTDGITFHVFPLDNHVRKKWITKINREGWSPTKYTKICSLHFEEEDFIITKKGCRKIREGALPCLQINTKVKKHSSVPLTRNLLGPPTNDVTRPLTIDSTVPFTSDTTDLNTILNCSDTPRIRKLKHEIIHLRYKTKKDHLKIRKLQMNVRCLKTKISSMAVLIKNLDENGLLFGDNSEVLSSRDVEILESYKNQILKTKRYLPKKFQHTG